MAPLATPVVPPVYCSIARSVKAISTGVCVWRAPFLSTSLNLTTLGKTTFGTIFLMYFTAAFNNQRFGMGCKSAISVRTIFSMPVFETTFAAVSATFACSTSNRAPESFS